MAMRAIRPAMTALALCLAACGTQLESNGAGEEKVIAKAGAGNSTAAGAPQAAAGNSAAETPAGACPFATRGWEATVFPPSQPEEKTNLALNFEARPDKECHMPMTFTLGVRRPPALVLELTSDHTGEPQANRGWMATGVAFEDYDPAYTHVAVRCADAEIARIPIPPAQ